MLALYTSCCTTLLFKGLYCKSGHRTGKGQFSFHPTERQYQRIFKLPHSCTYFTRLQGNAQNSPSRLQQYMNWEIPDVQAGYRKGKGTRDEIANIHWIIEKAREFQKNIYFCIIDYAKAFDYVDHNKLWKTLREMEMPDHLNCLLRSLYTGQEATVRIRNKTMDWFHIGKGVLQGCILSLCEMPGWMKHKLELRLPGEISITSDMQMTPPLWQKVKKN